MSRPPPNVFPFSFLTFENTPSGLHQLRKKFVHASWIEILLTYVPHPQLHCYMYPPPYNKHYQVFEACFILSGLITFIIQLFSKGGYMAIVRLVHSMSPRRRRKAKNCDRSYVMISHRSQYPPKHALEREWPSHNSPAFVTVPYRDYSIAGIVQPLLLGRPSVSQGVSATTPCYPLPARTKRRQLMTQNTLETRTARTRLLTIKNTGHYPLACLRKAALSQSCSLPVQRSISSPCLPVCYTCQPHPHTKGTAHRSSSPATLHITFLNSITLEAQTPAREHSTAIDCTALHENESCVQCAKSRNNLCWDIP